MNTFIARLHRFSRITVASLGLLSLALSVALAEGWGNLGGIPPWPRISVTSSQVVYSNGNVLDADGTYTTSDNVYSMPPATYDAYGDLVYSEGTTLRPDGSWYTQSY